MRQRLRRELALSPNIIASEALTSSCSTAYLEHSAVRLLDTVLKGKHKRTHAVIKTRHFELRSEIEMNVAHDGDLYPACSQRFERRSYVDIEGMGRRIKVQLVQG